MSTYHPSNASLRRCLVAVGAAIAIAAGLFTTLTSGASVATAKPSAITKPTIVLVHGAFADASGWLGVTERLQRAGYTVVAPANPLRSLYGDAAYIAGVLDQIPGPIVLVGHSYGGAVITNAAAGNNNVKALVYVDAFIPAVGEKVLDLAGTRSLLPSSLELQGYPPFSSTDVEAYIDPRKYPAVFAGDLPIDLARAMAASQRPLALLAGEQPTTAAAWQQIPSWDVIGMADKVITPAQQLMMATRAHAKVTEIPGASHVSMISHPGAVTAVIERAAAAVG
jgi:pimeloyl-ACP methyl ester carboxylesterase